MEKLPRLTLQYLLHQERKNFENIKQRLKNLNQSRFTLTDPEDQKLLDQDIPTASTSLRDSLIKQGRILRAQRILANSLSKDKAEEDKLIRDLFQFNNSPTDETRLAFILSVENQEN